MPAIFKFWQLPKSPRRHERHVPSWPPCQPTPTRCPFFHPETPAPTSSITPATSCPGTRGYWIPGHAPSFTSESLWHTPQACTLMRTALASGLGISRSTSSKSPPGLAICAAFIGLTATFVVAIPASFDLSFFLVRALSVTTSPRSRHFTPLLVLPDKAKPQKNAGPALSLSSKGGNLHCATWTENYYALGNAVTV